MQSAHNGNKQLFSEQTWL